MHIEDQDTENYLNIYILTEDQMDIIIPCGTHHNPDKSSWNYARLTI